MRQKQITFDDGDERALITVRMATVEDRLLYEQMDAEARAAYQAWAGETPEPVELAGDLAGLRANAAVLAEYTASVLWWPAVAATTVEAEGGRRGEPNWGWPLGLKAWLSLSPELLDQWINAVFELNPAWRTQSLGPDEAKKGAPPREPQPTG